jgi:hypothetical protein
MLGCCHGWSQSSMQSGSSLGRTVMACQKLQGYVFVREESSTVPSGKKTRIKPQQKLLRYPYCIYSPPTTTTQDLIKTTPIRPQQNLLHYPHCIHSPSTTTTQALMKNTHIRPQQKLLHYPHCTYGSSTTTTQELIGSSTYLRLNNPCTDTAGCSVPL